MQDTRRLVALALTLVWFMARDLGFGLFPAPDG